ncbi:MAG: hypothetical protein FWE07_04870 [Turicibacter sp.]|nr:hypothetical protein [Turicibacter sp.]
MNRLKDYVEVQFQNFPATEESLTIKANILASMEDKYADLVGSGTPDDKAFEIVSNQFGDIDELRDVLFTSNTVPVYEKLKGYAIFFQKPYHSRLLILFSAFLSVFILIAGFHVEIWLLAIMTIFTLIFFVFTVLMHPSHFDDPPKDLHHYISSRQFTLALFSSLLTALVLIVSILNHLFIIFPWIYSRALQTVFIDGIYLYNLPYHFRDVIVLELISIFFIFLILFITMLIIAGRIHNQPAKASDNENEIE